MSIVEVGSVAFTASRALPDDAHDVLRGTVQQVKAGLYITGACVGGDQEIATLAAEIWPRARQRIIVPRDRSRVDEVWLSTFAATHPLVQVLQMPRGTTYRDRNLALLGEGFIGVPPVRPYLLVGFPLHSVEHERSQRSGTWMTIRLARARGIPQRIRVLAGEPVLH